jgi:pyridine nucleotide-disulfide oxidoreductase family protein
MRTVVLLGIGHTHAHVVRRWAREPIADARLICVSDFPVATYSGMLPGVLSGQFAPHQAEIDLQRLTARAGAELILADRGAIELETRRLRVSPGRSLDFDVLSIGVGSQPVGVEAIADDESVVPIKPMQTFAERFDTKLAAIDGTTPGKTRVAIIGGGAAGCEVACCLAARFARRADQASPHLSLYHGGDRVGEGLRSGPRRRLQRVLKSRGVELISSARIERAEPSHLVAHDGRRFRCDLGIWITGPAPAAVMKSWPLAKDTDGFLATSPTLQSLSDPRIFAVGDCATIVDHPGPKAGVNAVEQGPILWHNLRALLAGDRLSTFQPRRDFLKLLNTGAGKALLEYGNFTAHARWCWWLKSWIDLRFVRRYQCEATSQE